MNNQNETDQTLLKENIEQEEQKEKDRKIKEKEEEDRKIKKQELSRLASPSQLRTAFKKLVDDYTYVPTTRKINGKIVGGGPSKIKIVSKHIKELEYHFGNIQNLSDTISNTALATVLVMLNSQNLPSLEQQESNIEMAKIIEEEQKKLKQQMNNIIFFLKIKKLLSFHYFGTAFRFLFNSKFRKAISQSLASSSTSNSNKELQSEFNKANRRFLSATAADLLFWGGVGLMIAGIFFPPLLVPGIILFGASVMIHAYLDTSYQQDKKHQFQEEEKKSQKDSGSSYSKINNALDNNYGHSSDTNDDSIDLNQHSIKVTSDDSSVIHSKSEKNKENEQEEKDTVIKKGLYVK